MADRPSTNRLITRTQTPGYISTGWNAQDVNEDALILDSHADDLENYVSRILDVETAIPLKADLVNGLVPSNQLPDISDSQYLGGWNATTNTPSISDAVGTAGQFYIIDTGGTQDLGNGNTVFVEGGKAYHNGTIWEPKDPVDAVASVQGRTGSVTITKTDLGIANVENKSSATIRSEIIESNIPVAIARVTAIPTTLASLADDATHRTVTDSEKVVWNTQSSTIEDETIDLGTTEIGIYEDQSIPLD